jgi:hypothetical protein
LKYLIRTRLRYISMFRSCHGSLRTNRCFDVIASEISSLVSPSPDLMCLLQHYSVGYFKPAAQNSYCIGQTITIPDETTICEFCIRNPDITFLIPRDLSRLSSRPYLSIITTSYDR